MGCATSTPTISIDPSCDGRLCRRVSREGASALACDDADPILRREDDLRVRATGCGRTVVYACEDGCAPEGEPISPPREQLVAYRAGIALHCDPRTAEVREVEGGLEAACRDVALRFACDDDGCDEAVPVDDDAWALRAVETEMLACLERRRAAVIVRFNERGTLVQLEADGVPAVRRTTGRTGLHVSPEGRSGCLREILRSLPELPSYAGRTQTLALGSDGYVAPSAVRGEIFVADAAAADTSDDAPAATDPVGEEPGADASATALAHVARDGAPAEPETDVMRGEPASASAGAASGESSAEEGELTPEARVRAAVDARRAVLLACADADVVAIELRPGDEGRAIITLRGDASGGPEEACIAHALAELSWPEGLEGPVVHVVSGGS